MRFLSSASQLPMFSASLDAAPGSVLSKTPSLYVVATPLGNLGDVTLRARAVLAAVDVVAAEDTRHSQRLLDALGIRTRLVALHEHNEEASAAGLIQLLGEGRSVALITDAGTPAVSDPGARAVARVQEAGHPVVPVPGPSAAIAALSASGLTDAHFHFHGFLPVKSAARCSAIEGLRTIPATLVFYEAPHRIAETVADLAAVLEPGRQLVIARELTKLFEQIVRLPLPEGPAWLAADPNRCRGEFVLLVSAPPPAQGLDPAAERVLSLLLAELPVKSAARLAAEITGKPRNLFYERALALKDQSSPPV
jgi:16S rRNA (cytidine1402-2'-O)-methyltransferase